MNYHELGAVRCANPECPALAHTRNGLPKMLALAHITTAGTVSIVCHACRRPTQLIGTAEGPVIALGAELPIR